MKYENTFDVIIVGASAAGLSAALMLGRCMRKVLVFDAGKSEVGHPPSTSGYLGIDGCDPSEFMRRGKEELRRYDTVSYLRTTVRLIERNGVGFIARCSNGAEYTSKSVLLASDDVPKIPHVPGAEKFYGRTLHQCPYCDAWQYRYQKLGVLGSDASAVELAEKLLMWSHQVTLFENGPALENPLHVRRLLQSGVRIVSGNVVSLTGKHHKLENVRVDDGSLVECDALFFSAPKNSSQLLASRLGCDMERSATGGSMADGATTVQGVYVARNTFRTGEFAIVAAAEGVKVAAAINDWLMEAGRSYLANAYAAC